MARHFLWVTAQIASSFPKVPILWRVITMIWLKPGVLLQQSVKLSSFLLELSMWLTTEITRWLPNWSFTTSSATRDSPSEQLWLPKPIESETCRLPDADQDTSNTFCWPIILSILPLRPQNYGSRSPSRFPYCPRSSIERFPEDCTEESTPAQQSLVSLSRAGDWDTAEPFGLCSNTAKLLATDPFGGGGNGGWATKTILDGPELDAASITCLGTGGGSFRAAVILTRCSVSIQPVEMRLQMLALNRLESSPLQSRPLQTMLKHAEATTRWWTRRTGWMSWLPRSRNLFGQECTGTRWRTHQNCYLLRLSPTTRPMPVDCSPENVPDRSDLCLRQEADLTAANGSKTRYAESDENVDWSPTADNHENVWFQRSPQDKMAGSERKLFHTGHLSQKSGSWKGDPLIHRTACLCQAGERNPILKKWIIWDIHGQSSNSHQKAWISRHHTCIQ